MALTAHGFTMSIDWVLFRGVNSDIENKSKLWGLCWGQVAILGVANEREELLIERRDS